MPRSSSLSLLMLVLFSLAASPPTYARQSDADWRDETLLEIDAAELRVRLAPLSLEDLQTLQEEAMGEVRDLATTLSAAIADRMAIERSGEPDPDAIAAAEARIATVMKDKPAVLAKANVLLDAIEVKGGDPAASRAYIAAVELLDRDVSTKARALGSLEPEEAVRVRAAELIAVVRAEPPAHERTVPWEVPLAEFELELQPLPVATILERLEKWRALLQREVRKRVRIDILLSDAEKLEQVRQVRREAAPAGGGTPEVELAALKARLAEQSQEQQAIITAIVKRMNIAIRLVEIRGGDATTFARYITAATGQKLNLADPTVLQAQVFAWLRSPDGGGAIALAILKFLGIALVAWLLGRFLGGLTGAAVKRVPQASSLLGPILAGAVRRITLFIGLVIGVSFLGVDIGPLLALIGAAGLVIGLALQGTLSNFASGILILLTRPFDVGDVISAGGVFGTVEAMSLVSTRVVTFDNQINLVPNNQVWNGVITNVTGKNTRRVDLTFGVGYADDMDQALEIIAEVVTSHAKVHAEPAPIIKVAELADNSVNIIARPWTRTEDYWDVYWDLTHQIKARFDAEGVNIPFPQRDIHVPGPIEVRLSRGDTHADAAAPIIETRAVSSASTSGPASAEPAPVGESD